MTAFCSPFDEKALSVLRGSGRSNELMRNEKFNELVDHSQGNIPRVDCPGGAVLEFGPLFGLGPDRAISSVVERFLHTEEATGSIPVSPTMLPSALPFYPMRNVDLSRNERTPRILDRNEGVGYTSDCLLGVSGLSLQ